MDSLSGISLSIIHQSPSHREVARVQSKKNRIKLQQNIETQKHNILNKWFISYFIIAIITSINVIYVDSNSITSIYKSLYKFL